MNKEEAEKLIDQFYKAVCDWYKYRSRVQHDDKDSDHALMEDANNKIYEYRLELLAALTQEPNEPDLCHQCARLGEPCTHPTDNRCSLFIPIKIEDK